MTAILAIYNRLQNPVEPAILAAMLAPTHYRARDGEDVWVDGCVALAHQHFWVTPEEVGEEQPLVDGAGQVALSFDGRIDNRAALARALELSLDPKQPLSDARLVMAAYLRWGKKCVERLLGDFVLIIWDKREQQLFVARDALGGRDLLFFVDDKLCLVASEASQLIAHPAVEPAINDEQIFCYMNNLWDDPDQTVLQHIYECPPAHCLVVSASKVQRWRYWDIDPAHEIHYQHDHEYAEHFLAVMTAAVGDRLRATGAIGVSMSGGMDSPSIAAVAARLMQASGLGRLKSFSYVFDELTQCDEREWILPVIAACDLDATLIPGDDLWTLKDSKRWPVFLEFPGQDYLVWLTISILEQAQAADCRIMLTGRYGDALFAGSAYWAADVIREGRLAQVLPTLLRQRMAVNWRRDLVDNGLKMLAPESVRTGYRRLKRRREQVSHPGLGPRLQSCWTIAGDQSMRHYKERFPTPGRWQRYRTLVQRSMSSGTALLRQRSIPFGIEYVNPFIDRRLAEFVMAVPGDQLGWPLQEKRVLREAMAGFLPEGVRRRTEITSLGPMFEKGLLHQERDTVEQLLVDPLIVQLGYVAAGWLRQELAAGRGWQHDGYLLWQCISLELWLQRWWS